VWRSIAWENASIRSAKPFTPVQFWSWPPSMKSGV
jgi:hypothetical protein